MKFSTLVLSLTVAIFLTACGDNVFEGDGTGTGAGGTVTDDKGSNLNSISKLEIIGSGDAIGGVTPIIANVNGGEFTLIWVTTSSNPYDFEVSIGASLSDSNLEIVYRGTGECKTNNCPATKTLKCNLIKNQGGGIDYSLNCAAGGNLIVNANEFENFKSIVLKICNQNTSDCAAISVLVSLGG